MPYTPPEPIKKGAKDCAGLYECFADYDKFNIKRWLYRGALPGVPGSDGGDLMQICIESGVSPPESCMQHK